LPFADTDEDGDVDQQDFARLQLCVNTGLFEPPASLSEECRCFDRNKDKVIGTYDLARFAACVSGPSVPWQSSPECP